MEAKDFQRNSANRIVELFNQGRQRVLLADEVGLGKTIVARTVIKMMKAPKTRKLKVIYVCSNQTIIQQNAHKLGIDKDNVVPLSESRLSMQHKILYDNLDNEYLIPITPSTSLNETNGYGNANERSLIYSLISCDFKISERKKLKWYLDVYADKKTNSHTHLFQNDELKQKKRKITKETPQYYKFIRDELKNNEDYYIAVNGIKKELHNKKQNRRYINTLRTIFSEISMDMIKPDLVIMDEFQRYRDLMKGGKDTEENRLAQRLFNAESNPKILLVSATPYKPMTTIEEISQTGKNEQYEDFKYLMQFLMGDRYDEFEPRWKKYSSLMATLAKDKVNELIAAKKEVEEMLKQVMVRTERYVPNLAVYQDVKVKPTTEEVVEYKKIREVLTKAAKELNRTAPSLNIDYVKSSPYLFSFMQQYVEKNFVEHAFKEKKGPKRDKFEGLLLREEDLEKRKKIDLRNARLSHLYKMLFSDKKGGMANLLWIPPSMPYYYNTNSIFHHHAKASKILVFSKWGFVPRMIATMVSYEARRRMGGKDKNSNNALNDYKELLLSPFPKIAEWFNKEEGRIELTKLKTKIREKLLRELKPYKKTILQHKKGRGYKNLLTILKLLNGDYELKNGEKLIFDNQTQEEIVNIVIAAPGVCMWRCFGNDYGSSYEICCNRGLYKFTNAFVNMLGDDESQAVIQRNIRSGSIYDRTLKYCVLGNLQAMIDEYAYVLGYSPSMEDKKKKELWTVMESAIITRTTLDIDTDESFCISNRKKKSLSRWFACDFAKITSDEKDEKRKQNVQAAFNSPFRPFVLASTSVGQEGLDFHLYCRKIVHWNLPGNPINLEQRSGRINRYEGLAIRRSVAHFFSDEHNWNRLFEKAENEWKKLYSGYNDLVPHWCLPQEVMKDMSKIEQIENYFLLYPMSYDIEGYSNLMKQLKLYRLTMGQPDQEYIIHLLEKLNLSEDCKDKLTFHLSP